MTASDIITGAASVFGVLASICGWVWLNGKSAERSEENQKRIAIEVQERKDEIARLSKLIDKNEVDSRDRARTNAILIASTEARFATSVDAFKLSRETHDKESNDRLNGLNNSVMSLGQQQGEMKGILNTFIQEIRSRKNSEA